MTGTENFRARWLAALCAALLAAAPDAPAQSANDGFAAAISAGAVHDVAVDGNGKIMVAGNFTFAGGTRRVARLHPDGWGDGNFISGINATAGVAHSILPIGNGYLVGGSFTGGSSPNYLAQLSATGANVASLGVGVNGTVHTVNRRANGNGYFIGGEFTTVNGATRNRVARLTSSLTSDTGFNPPNFYGTVYDVVERPDGKVYVSGAFFGITANAGAGYAVFRLNSNGSLDNTFVFDAVPQGIEHVLAMDLQPDGKLLIAGNFTATAGGEQRRRIARLNDDGSLDLAFQGPTLNDSVVDMAVQPDGRIVIAGPFTGVGLANDIARLEADGSVDTSFSLLFDPNGLVRSVAVQGDGGVLFAGEFTSITGSQPALRVARIPKTGGLERTFAPGGSTVGDVHASAVLANGDVLAGGTFTSIGGDARTYLARFSGITGALSTSFTPSLNGSVLAIVVQADGKFLVGGGFTLVNGTTRRRIARFNADGTLDASFVPANIPDGVVHAIEVDPLGRIYVGGSFQSVGAESRRFIVRLTATGAIDAEFEDPELDDDVLAIAMAADHYRVYIGGRFTEVDGFERNAFARLWPHGGMNTGFGGLMCDPGDAVMAIAVPPEGGVVAGGDFECVRSSVGSNGNYSYNLSRFAEDGTVVCLSLCDLEINGSVHSIQLMRDGGMHIGGAFTEIGLEPTPTLRQGLARLLADGSLDTRFDVPAITPVLQPAWVNTQVLQGDGRLIVGGRFENLGGVARSNLGRIGSRGRVLDEIVSMPSASRVQWQRGIDSPAVIGAPQLLISTTCCSATSFTPLPGTMTWSSALGGSWRYEPFPTVFGTYYLRTRARIGSDSSGSLYESPIVRFDGGPAPTATADLSITKSVIPLAAEPGDSVTFTVQVTNLGPDSAPASTVQDLLPSGYSYLSHSVSQGSYVPATGLWTVGSLVSGGAGATRVMTVVATVNASGDHVNLASASSAAFDPDLNNSIDFAEVTVLEPADDTIFAHGFEVPQ